MWLPPDEWSVPAPLKRSVRAKSDAVTLDGNAIPRALSSATNVTTHERLIHLVKRLLEVCGNGSVMVEAALSARCRGGVGLGSCYLAHRM